MSSGEQIHVDTGSIERSSGKHSNKNIFHSLNLRGNTRKIIFSIVLISAFLIYKFTAADSKVEVEDLEEDVTEVLDEGEDLVQEAVGMVSNTPYCTPDNNAVTIITTPTPTQGDVISSSDLECSDGYRLQSSTSSYNCLRNILSPTPCNKLCPTPSGMEWVGLQPIVGNIDITSLECSNDATPSPSTGNFTCVDNGISSPPTCNDDNEGYENYIDQIFSWISGRPDINSSSKYSLLPGYYS